MSVAELIPLTSMVNEEKGTEQIQHTPSQKRGFSNNNTKTRLALVVTTLATIVIIGFVWRNNQPTSTSSIKDAVQLSFHLFPFSPMSPDESVLTWLNKSDVHPGGTACGFMTVPLGSRIDLENHYPDVKVYICMKFAKTQPAPKGTLFGHCGGPGTLSGCGLYAGSVAGDDYNIVGIDQRGLGRSHPTFATPSCTYNTIQGILADEESEEEVRGWLKVVRQRAFSCWKDPSFQLPAKGIPNSTFNFLQFSGTTQVAEDLNRFRKAIGADKLSFHVISYGTFIGQTYATMFPQHVDKFVLNSPMPPLPDSRDIALGAAAGNQQQYDNLFNACNLLGPKCPIQGVSTAEAMRTVALKLRQLNFQIPLSKPETYMLLKMVGLGLPAIPSVWVTTFMTGLGQAVDVESMRNALADWMPLYEAAKNNNDAGFQQMITDAVHGMLTPTPEVLALVAAQENQTKRLLSYDDCGDKPTPRTGPKCQPNYFQLINSGSVAQSLIMSQSTSGAPLNENFFIAQWKRALRLYPNSGLQRSIKWFRWWWGITYAWPRSTPTASLASPTTKGIIVGFLYDPNTPYKWAQQAHENFPSTSLVTSQASQHGLMPGEGDDPKSIALNDCFGILARYFEDGTQPVNGQLCRAPMPLVA